MQILKQAKPRYWLLLVCVFFVNACDRQPTGYDILGGGRVNLAELEGKMVFINYWAQWCAPCRVEIPEFNHFAKEYADDVRVLSVNFDGVLGESLKAQVQSLGIEFDTLLQDPRQDLSVPLSGGLPETIVLNRQGLVVAVLLGPQTKEDLHAVFKRFEGGITPKGGGSDF